MKRNLLLADQGADEAAIKELFAKRDAAWNAHDATAWSAFFAADGHFTSWRGHRVQGRENIRVFHERLFTGIYKASKNTTISIRITFHGADLAIAENDTEMTGAPDPAGQPVPDRKYYPLIVLKKNNGEWEISIFHNVRDQT
jgi:uncharacterized protein (TIGR02246 family)